ncbi:MAG: leucine-rich repeat domain-containing protein, partial [Saccharofermentans sp.]|nr:leucine-rich repeat domain-containing protein [Saccharofermentans sp.]
MQLLRNHYGQAIPECSLTELRLQVEGLPDKLNSIGWYAFNCCEKLVSVSLPDTVTLIDLFAFQECNSLKSISR